MTDADLDWEEPRETDGLVRCDVRDCIAKANPDLENLDEVIAAYEHWRNHSFLSGCSHGQ